jgi:RHS repeat-associated protein
VGLTNAAGTLVERYTYSAYGTLGIYAANGTVRSSSTCANRYTYTGREWDAELRLYHFRARWYDPATGGFVSRDPLGYVDGMSLYRGYFGLQGVDPSGNGLVVLDNGNGTGYRQPSIASVSLDPLSPDYASPDSARVAPSQRSMSFNLLAAILQRLPTSVQPVHFDARVFVFPLIPPAETVEAILFINGMVSKCCSENGGIGLYFYGTAGVEVSGGVGTSIGGNSGIAHGKRNWGRPRKDGKPNASQGRTYYYEIGGKRMYGSKPPIVGQKDYANNAITRSKRSADASYDLPQCPTEISGDIVGRIGVSGFVSFGYGQLSRRAQFDAPIGEISLFRGASAVWDQSSAGFVTGLGTGARIQVYGRGFGELVVPLVR